MEEAVYSSLESKMLKTDDRLDELAMQVGNIQQEIFADGENDIEVFTLLKSVNEVKNNYQNLRREISEVQEIQKQLSSSLQLQVRSMQSKFNFLKERITLNNGPAESQQLAAVENLPNLLLDVPTTTKNRCDSSSSSSVYGAPSF